MFYKDFAEDYEKIFPFRPAVYSFLKKYSGNIGSEILDAGCGTGHYCGRFVKDGYRADGIDLDDAMIAKAKETYGAADFRVLDIRNIASLNKKYDLIYSTGNVMAHISEDQFQKFLPDLKKIMHDSSIWIFQVVNWDYILSCREMDLPLISTGDREFIRKYREIDSRSLEFHTELRERERENTLFKDKVTLYPVTADSYKRIHEDAGLILRGHYGDYKGGRPVRDGFAAEIFVFSAKS